MARSNSLYGEGIRAPLPQVTVDVSPYNGTILTQGALYHPLYPDIRISLTLQRDPAGGGVSIDVKYDMSERQFRAIFANHPDTAHAEGFVRELLDRLVQDNQSRQIQQLTHLLEEYRRKSETPVQTMIRLLDAVKTVESGLEAYRTGGVPI